MYLKDYQSISMIKKGRYGNDKKSANRLARLFPTGKWTCGNLRPQFTGNELGLFPKNDNLRVKRAMQVHDTCMALLYGVLVDVDF